MIQGSKKGATNPGCFLLILSAIVSITIICSLGYYFSASFRRTIKSNISNWTGGLERTLTLYDYEGKVIRTWSGKFDISNSEEEVLFDLDNKRVIIHGGIVVVEER